MNGGVQCWGDNYRGELGNSSTTSSLVPVPVSGLTAGVQAISSGEDQTCAIVDDDVECWGDDTFGDLGNGAMNTYSDVPVPVGSWSE